MIEPTTQRLDEVVRDYVAMGSGLDSDTDVIPGNDGGPSPNHLFATVLLVEDESPGVPFVRHTDVEGVLRSQTLRAVAARYSLQFFRTGARDAARQLAVWVSSSAGRDEALRQHITVRRVSGIRRLDRLVDDEWEERVNVDLTIGYLESLTEPVDAIASAHVAIRLDAAAVEELEVDP